MANVLSVPLSGNIYFDNGSQDNTVPDLSGSAVALGFDGCAGLTVTSYNTASGDRFTVAGESGSLFSVNDSLTGTVFSVNDASGLPIIEVNSDEVTDTVAIGEFGTNALFVSAGNVGVGTNTPTTTLDVAGDINTTGNLLSGGSDLDSLFVKQTEAGVTCIATSGGITGGPITSSGTLSIASACNTKWDQSGCAGINCTGTTTASNTQTFTNKSGNISQWTNDSGYTTCTGDITGVTAGNGLTGGGSSGGVTLNVGAGTAITVAADTVGVTSACNTAWNAKTTCTGTVTSVGTSGGLCGGNITTSGTICIVPACCTEFKGAYTTAKALSACAGLSCVGDITAVTAGNGLTGGATTGAATLNVGAGTAITVAADSVGVTSACNTAWNAKTTCTGTVTCVNGGNGLTGAVTSSGSLNVGAGTGITVNTNDVAINSTCNTRWNGTATTVQSNSGSWDQSGCPGLNCTGDITAVTAGNGLTGGASSGAATLNVGAGTAITVAADSVGVTSACNTAWNNKTTCTGTVTSIATGSGITGGTITSSGTVSVDSTVARTNVDETFSCDVTINGDLTVNGDLVCLETIVSTTSALSVTNHGSGPAIVVNQSGSNDIANFTDDGTSVLYIEDGGNVGLSCDNPVQRLDVSGNINTSGDIRVDNNVVVNTGRCFVGVQVRPSTAIADAYIASAATWNAKTTCTGTVTCVNGGNGLTGAVTGSGSINVGAGTGICVTANAVCIATNCNTTWNSAYTTTKALSGCAGLTCTGDITAVTAGNGLTGGASSGAATLNVGAGTAITVAADSVGVTSACNTAWNAKTTCTGTVTSVGGGNGLTGTVTSSGSLNVGAGTGITVNTNDVAINSTCNTTWNSAYTTTKALSGCAGLTCTGDITAVTAGNGLTGGASSGAATLNVGAGTAITVAANTVGVTSACNTAWNAKTTCTGTFNTATAGLSGSGASVGIDSGTLTPFDQSGCPGINCVGDITGVTAGNGLTGGASSGAATLNVGAGTAITVAADTVGVTAACNTAWNAKTTCTGTVDTSGTPVDNDFAKFTDANTIEGRSCSEVRSDLGIGTAASCAVGAFATAAQGTTADNALPKAGGTMSGQVNYNNNNIIGVNQLCFNDPGPNEGLAWTGGNTKIYESPDNLTTNSAGNLQIVYGSTRRLTVNNTGIDVNGKIVGGCSNTAAGTRAGALVGCNNSANSLDGVIVAGKNNSIAGGNYSYQNIIVGGCCNSITGYFQSNNSIGGGCCNTICGYTSQTGIGSGFNNTIGNYSSHSFIAGGRDNQIGQQSSQNFIGTGCKNIITGAGGYNSSIMGGVSGKIENSCLAGILGGCSNCISSATGSAILGGVGNTVTHTCAMIAGTGITSLSANMLHANRFSVDDLPTSAPGVDSVVWSDGGILTQGAPRAMSWLDVGKTWAFSGLPFFNKTSGSTAQRLDGAFMTDLNTGSAASRRAQAVFGAAFNDISGYSGAGTDYSRALGASIKAGFYINGQNSAKVIFAVGLASTSGVYADANPISNYGFGVEFRRGSGSVYEWRVFGHNGTSLTASSWSSSGITYSTDPRTIAIYSDGSGNITAYTAMYGNTNYTTITTTGGPTATSGTSMSTNMVGLRCNTNASGYVSGAYAKVRASAVNFYAE